MNPLDIFQHIRFLLGNGKMEEALTQLKVFLGNSPQIDEVIQQEGRLAKIRKQIRMGTVSFENANLTENQIRQGILDLLRELEQLSKQPHLTKESIQAASLVYQYIAKGDINISNKTVIYTSEEQRKTAEVLTILWKKVKNNWIDSKLHTTFGEVELVNLFIEEKPELIDHPDKHRDEFSAPAKSEEKPQVDLFDHFLAGNKELLILGKPGSGKTTALLKICERLLVESEGNDLAPVPVVLNLSSWQSLGPPKGMTFEEWVIQELATFYHLDHDFVRKLINNYYLIFLFDGLDEIRPTYRASCLRGLNQFIVKACGQGVAVTSVSDAYQALYDQNHQLVLSSAIELQPLSPNQIAAYLQAAGIQDEPLLGEITQNPDLFELASNPLILTIISSVVGGNSGEHDFDLEEQISKISAPDFQASFKKELFEQFLKRMLARKTSDKLYSDSDAKSVLSWLAYHMKRHDETVFLVEGLQPSWLEESRTKFKYLFLSRQLFNPYALMFLISVIVAIVGDTFFTITSLILGISHLGYFLFVAWAITRLEYGVYNYHQSGNEQSLFSKILHKKTVKIFYIIAATFLLAFVGGNLDHLLSSTLFVMPEFAFDTDTQVGLGMNIDENAPLWKIFIYSLFYATNIGGYLVLMFAYRKGDQFSWNHDIILLGGENRIELGKEFWDWKRFLRYLKRYFPIGLLLVFPLAFAVMQFLLFENPNGLSMVEIFVMSIGAMILILPLVLVGMAIIRGFSVKSIKEGTDFFNEGIQTKIKNGFVTSFSALSPLIFLYLLLILFGAPTFVEDDPAMTIEFSFSIIVLFLLIFSWHGGFDVSLHYFLRYMLFKTKGIPFRDFKTMLDFLSSKNLLKKTGGGYRFFHKDFRDFMAAQYVSE